MRVNNFGEYDIDFLGEIKINFFFKYRRLCTRLYAWRQSCEMEKLSEILKSVVTYKFFFDNIVEFNDFA